MVVSRDTTLNVMWKLPILENLAVSSSDSCRAVLHPVSLTDQPETRKSSDCRCLGMTVSGNAMSALINMLAALINDALRWMT
jgi:hypothetical protein